jgi:hypothetical protein
MKIGVHTQPQEVAGGRLARFYATALSLGPCHRNNRRASGGPPLLNGFPPAPH